MSTPLISLLQPPRRRAGPNLLATILLFGLAGCGGGGGSSGTSLVDDGSTWVRGVFEPSTDFDALCVAPRSGIDPVTGRPYPDRQGTTLDENNWLRSWSNELYLWYDEIVDRNPALYATLAYFDLLKTDELTASGRPKDNFHFSLPTDEWQAFAQSGEVVGYGVIWAIQAAVPPRDIRVGFVEPGSTAAGAPSSVVRGMRVLAIDGFDIDDNTQAGVDALNAALFPAEAGEPHVFRVEDPQTLAVRNVTLTSEVVTTDPVHGVDTVDTGNGVVGYLLFNEHVATAEGELINAVNELAGTGIDDLVVDLRYNSGGFLDIASELSYMIAGPLRTTDRTFELLRFNDKHPTINPVTGAPIQPMPFHDTAVLGVSVPVGAPLPNLDLARVFLLTGPETCSASESIVNGLRGIGVEVIQIGATTCGKPYGFYPTDNCGTTYFTVQFQGVNDTGFGDYPDGFSPANLPGAPGVPVPGCAVADDFSRALGDPLEARFAAALAWRQTGSCPAPSGFATPGLAAARSVAPGAALPAPDAAALRPPAWRQARVMGGIAP